MQRTYLKDVEEKIGQEVKIDGFVQARRDQGGIKFLVLRDVTGTVQCVVMKQSGEVFDQVGALSLESVVEVFGLVKEQKQAPNGFEVEIKSLKVLSVAEALPIPVVEEKGGNEVDASLRFDYRWIDLRKPEKLKIFKVWTALERGFRKAYDEAGFTQIYTPSMMGASSEGGSEVFEVKYFDKKAYLAQSPQFYKQMAMASGFERVYIFGPAYRAEPSFTTRHMTDFTMWDMEMSFVESHKEVMAMGAKLIVEGFAEVKKVLPELEIPTLPFLELTVAQVKEKLAKRGVKSEKETDMSPEEEREICKLVKEETGQDFVYITDWAAKERAFYSMRCDDNMEFSKTFDLLYRGLEINSGAQREHRPDMIVKNIQAKGLDVNQFTDYINFFKYGCPPHGGLAFGPARIVMKILGLESVKDATFLPRDVKRLTP